MALNPKLQPFLKLQEVDSERYRLRKAIEAAEQKKGDPRKKLAQAKTALVTAEAQRLAKERTLQDAQLRLKVEEERLQKLEKQMLTLTSGKEYKTMEHQIRGKKADKSLIEDEILHVMDEVEATRKASAEAKDAVQNAEGAAKSVEDSVFAANRESVERLKVLDEEAAALEQRCERDILGQYRMLLERRHGLSIAPIVNRICQGCYTSVTPQEENKALQGQIVNCGNCQRFVYLP
jgi:predicted  nucleic acid-binding Zn-ribbon protein